MGELFVCLYFILCNILPSFVCRESNVFAESAKTAADEDKKRAAANAMEEQQMEEAKRLSLLSLQQKQQLRQLPLPAQPQHPFAQFPPMQHNYHFPMHSMQQPKRGKAERQEEYNERVVVQVSNLMTDGTPATKLAANEVLGDLCDTTMNRTNLVVRGASAVETPAVGESPDTAALLVNRAKENSSNK
jgi:hypothetical protein